MLELILSYVILPAMGVLWFITMHLWKQKEARAAAEAKALYDKATKDIDVLFVLHKEDAEKLTQLQLVIAGKHYERGELDERFKQLDVTLREGFKELSVDIRAMTTSLHATYNDHISQHHNNNKG